MGLKFIGAVDLKAFSDAIIAAQGVDFAIENRGTSSSDGMPQHTYLHQLDKVILTTRSSGSDINRLGINPLLFGVNVPDAFLENSGDFVNNIPLLPGDPLLGGGQKLYASSGGVFPGSEWENVDPVLSLTQGGVGAFPTVPAGNGPIRVILGIGTAIPPGPGTWNGGSATFGFWIASGCVFEGLTDGILGETNLTGPNVYPAGLMLFRARIATCPAPIGTGGAGDCTNALVWLDLATGLVDGRMNNTPGAAFVSGPNTEAPIAGQQFFWNVGQYIPDSDATVLQPKGELLIVSDDNAIPADPSNFPQSVFLKVIDYNPFNAVESGDAPPRIHERIRLRSSVDFDDNPMFDVSTAAAARNDVFRLMFHPPSNRFFMVLAVQAATTPVVADEAFIGYWARQVEPAFVTSPVARTTPRSNDITEWEAFVQGTLAEPVGGTTVDWTLVRVSTELEVLNASVFPGTSTVANPPIDQAFPVVNEGTLVVRADSVVLVEGVDYTVNLATGIITWITDQSGATLVDASYEHRETDASPSHGDLLSTSSISDDEGGVVTSILYGPAPTLVGALDVLRNALA